MRLVVCLPTYEERDNIEPMVHALDETFRASGLDDAHVLVIDDNSPDGTGAIADGLAAKHPWVQVLHRPRKQGLGPAYVAGFHRALADGADLVVEMDCDFSHDPADVPRLVASMQHADLVLGSRYVPGGRIENWGPGRRAVSRLGSWYARIVLGLPFRDLTGGFKCFRRVVLEGIDLDTISARGYAFQIETTYRATQAGFRVAEIPIAFVDREVGGSKMTKAIVAEAVWRVPTLRFQASRRRL
ncbi:MAG TPA: polyprenol monophosphomannose synthase [Gaiellaceae bacterium]